MYGGMIFLSVLFFGISILGIPRIKISEYFDLNPEMIRVLKDEKPERLFNFYNYGGELVYHDIPVFIDGRADLYSPYNFKDYLTITKFESGSVYFMKQYNFDYYLVSNGTPIFNYLLQDSTHYQIIYTYDKASLFKKIETQ
jgi:hypothetical protein